jgi:glycosyltransferase involved in cell wall biosynthesis
MGVEVLYGPVDLPAWIAAHGPLLDWVWSARPDVTEPLLDAVERFAGGRLIYYTHDLHFLREQRRHELDSDPQSLTESRRLRRIERDIFRRARRVVTPSADEVKVIRGLVPDADARVVPPYPVPAAPVQFVGAEAFAARDTVLFVGGYAHLPNVDGALWLAQEIMPLIWRDAPWEMPRPRLVLAGSKPPAEVLALAGERIDVPGWVPDLGPLYDRARLSINPLRYGAGVKGKIIASLQAGVPVVTTAVGNEGIALRDGVEAVIGDTPEALAAGALALLGDPALCARLASAGATVLRRRFSEDATRRELMATLGQAICPVCGHRTVADPSLGPCEACGAEEVERSLAEAAIRPWRGLRVGSLRDAGMVLTGLRVRLPAGPLASAVGREGEDRDLDLLVTEQRDGGAPMRPGGRWVFAVAPPDTPETVAADLAHAGWEVRLHEADERAIVEAAWQQERALSGA